MSVLISKDTKVICQGFTGSQGTFPPNRPSPMAPRWWRRDPPGKGGTTHSACRCSTPLEAVEATGAEASVIYVPAPFCKDSILEAAFGGIS